MCKWVFTLMPILLYSNLMDVQFKDSSLEKLEAEEGNEGNHPPGIVSKYRMRMQLIRAASNEQEFYNLKSLHFEKLKGKRAEQYSMRLNDQWRLTLKFIGSPPNRVVEIIGIEDYH